MKTKLLITMLLLFVALPLLAQSGTFLQLDLRWGAGGPPVANATTTLLNSKGVVIATMAGASPRITLPLGLDVYTIKVQAPNANGHPLLNWSVDLPMATTIADSQLHLTVNSYRASVAFDPTGLHGTITASIAAEF